MDFNTLKNEILKLPPTEPVFIYIGVGTMAGLLNSDGTLAPDNYHQYPPFVQDLHNRVENLNVCLVLIDPLQENPPYLERDYPVEEVQPDHFKSAGEKRLQVFVHRKRVYTEPDDFQYYDENAINITELLRDLNDFALLNHVSLLYHDFTGRRTASIAEYFDYDYSTVSDQIVYAMSARENHGCYFDLSKSNAYFATRVERSLPQGVPPFNPPLVREYNPPLVREYNPPLVGVVDRSRAPIVKMFNYYKFIVNNKYDSVDAEIMSYPVYMHPFIEEQKQQIINDIRTQFKNTNIATLRQIKKILLHPEEDIDPNIYLYNYFTKYIREFLLELLQKKEYELLSEMLFNTCADKLNILARLKDMDLNGEQILKFITADPDPYKWYKSIAGFLG